MSVLSESLIASLVAVQGELKGYDNNNLQTQSMIPVYSGCGWGCEGDCSGDCHGNCAGGCFGGN